MADSIPVKLVVLQLDCEPEQHLFEQDMIKFGRGRTGKARTGVDLQLSDPTVARVHGVIQVKRLGDVSLLPMGTAATYINGTKIKSHAKLKNGVVMEMGTTQITVYIGEAAAHDYLADSVETVEGGDTFQDTAANLVEGEISIESGEYEIVSGEQSVIESGMSPSVTSSEGWAEAFADQPSTEASASQAGSAASSGHISMEASREFTSSAGGYSLYPMHAEPEGTYGPMGPTPPPLPEQFPEANLEMLLEVADRLGKESWYVQEILW